jgi:hypothetical protein
MPAPTIAHLEAQADMLSVFQEVHPDLGLTPNPEEQGDWFDGRGIGDVYAEAKDKSAGKIFNKFRQFDAAPSWEGGKRGLCLDITKRELFDHVSFFINRFKSPDSGYEFEYYEVELTKEVWNSAKNNVGPMEMGNCDLVRDAYHIHLRYWRHIARRKPDSTLELVTGKEQYAHRVEED